MAEHRDQRDEPTAPENDDPQENLERTADFWRSDVQGTSVEDSADEVARGAERAAQQPDYGREGQ